jgi:ATP-dependent RNA helicase RhlE
MQPANTPATATESGFTNLGIAPKLLEILTRQKFTVPTPIQLQSIPAAIEGKDVMGIAQTGTGKTLAFGVPMIQALAQSRGKKRGLIILPTRELAVQVSETLKKIGATLGLKTAILIGGESAQKQIRALHLNPHIIIATPGRLIDHMETKKVDLSNVGVLVLDEADRMLDMGFAPQIKKILDRVPRERQTMLFSATMPDAILNIAHSYMSLPLRVEVAPAGTAVKTVTQELFFVDKRDKPTLLKTTLEQYKGSVLVFSRTKFGAKKLATLIRNMGYTASEIHSNRSLNQRLEALEGFKLGRYRILVATDIAARGIDVTGIQLVINYDLPDNAEDYVHRIGRTGRAGLAGHAISFATPDQRGDVRSIERLIRTTLPVSKTSIAPRTGNEPRLEYIPEPERGRGGRMGGGRRSDGRSGHSRFNRENSRPHSPGGHSRFSRPASSGSSFRRDGKPSSSRGKFDPSKRRTKSPASLSKTPTNTGGGFFLKRAKSNYND